MSNSEPPRDRRSAPPDGFLLHPLTTLDGVMIYATLRGEHVGTYFGPTEQAATAALAADLFEHAEVIS